MMKKKLSMLLLAAMLIGLLAGCGGKPTETTKAPDAGATKAAEETKQGDPEKKVETVTYFCGIGAYLGLLQEEINKWNAGEGAEKGVYIQLTSDIDNFGTSLRAMAQAGNFPDIYDYSYSYTDFTANGWNRDFRDIPELAELVDRFKDYLVDGVHYHNGKLIGLPLEVIPVKFAVNMDLFEKNNLELPKTWDDVVAAAKVITENGGGVDYGYGFTYKWSAGFRRMAMKASTSSVGVGYFDNTKKEFDFSPFKTAIEAHAQMYQDGSMFPDPAEISIDGIRSQFAEGHVGMITCLGYDIAVYNDQFPAKCNWKVIDCPTYTEGEAPYYGIYLNRGGVGITSAVSDDRMWAVAEAVKFLYSYDLYCTLYANGAIIPHEPSISESTALVKDVKNLKEMADLTNYRPEPLRVDPILTLEGDNFNTVFQSVLLGDITFDEACADLNERYNAAYQKLKATGENLDAYEQPYDIKK